MAEISAFKFLPFIVIIGGLTWHFIQSSHVKLQLSLKSAIIVGLIRLGLALLTIIIVLLVSFLILTMLPAKEVVTFVIFIMALVFGTFFARKVDRLAQFALVPIFK